MQNNHLTEVQFSILEKALKDLSLGKLELPHTDENMEALSGLMDMEVKFSDGEFSGAVSLISSYSGVGETISVTFEGSQKAIEALMAVASTKDCKLV